MTNILTELTDTTAQVEFGEVSEARITGIAEKVAHEVNISYNDAFAGPQSIGKTINWKIKEFSALLDEFVESAIIGDATEFRDDELNEKEIGLVATFALTTKVFIANRNIKGIKDDNSRETARLGTLYSHCLASQFIHNNISEEKAISFWDGLRNISRSACLSNEKPEIENVEVLRRGVIAEIATAISLEVEGYVIEEATRADDLYNQIDLVAYDRQGRKVFIQCKSDAGLSHNLVETYDPTKNYDPTDKFYDLSRLVSASRRPGKDGADLAALVVIGFASPNLNVYTGETTKVGTDQIVIDLTHDLNKIPKRGAIK